MTHFKLALPPLTSLLLTVTLTGLAHGKPGEARQAPAQQGFSPKAANLPPELAPPAPPVERRSWNKFPIAITLPVRRERLVSFNAPVRLELPAELDEQVLRTQIVADGAASTVYLKAQAPFDVQRVQVQDINSGNVYLLDMKAAADYADTTPVEVTLPGSQPPAKDSASTAPIAEEPVQPPDYMGLTRMAAQHLYAPERLLTVPEGVYQAPVHQVPTASLYRGGLLEMTPIIAWRTDSIHVTALKIRNLGNAELVLDPRLLRGRWLAATFQHNLLRPKGDVRDTSAAYLISGHSFAEASDGLY